MTTPPRPTAPKADAECGYEAVRKIVVSDIADHYGDGEVGA